MKPAGDDHPAAWCWAVGAVLAGMEFYGDFVGHHEGSDFWGASIFVAEGNTVLHDSHDVSKLVKLSPFLAMLLGLGLAYWMYIRQPALPGKLAARHARISTSSCSTSGTSTSSTT